MNQLYDTNKVNPFHAKIINFLCYILPNITGLTYGCLSMKLISLNEELKAKK